VFICRREGRRNFYGQHDIEEEAEYVQNPNGQADAIMRPISAWFLKDDHVKRSRFCRVQI